MDEEQLRRAIDEAAHGTIAFLLDVDKALTELDALGDKMEPIDPYGVEI